MGRVVEIVKPRRGWLPLVAPILAVLLYLPTLSFPFVWDDFMFLADNDAVRSLANAPRFFFDGTTATSMETNPGLYRPLRNVLWAFEYTLWKDWPGGYHLVNFLLHALNGLLLWWLGVGLLAGLGREAARFGATVAATLWVAHPLLTEGVAWVKGGDDLLVATFCLLGGALAIRLANQSAEPQTAAARGNWRRWPGWGLALLALCHLGALSSKESGVVYPAIVFLVAWTALRLRNRPLLGRRSTRLSVAILLGIGLLFDLLYLAVRGRVVGSLAQVTDPLASGSALLWTQLRATARGLWLVVWPRGLLADYSGYPVSTEPGFVEIASLLVVAGLLTAAVVSLRRNPMVSLAIGIWFFGILPVSNLVPTMQFFAERFLYLPLIGPALLAGWAAARLWGENGGQLTSRRRRLLLTILLLVAALVAGTSARIPVWGSEVDLFGDTARRAPDNLRGLANYSLALFYRGRYAECLETLASVRRLDPEHDVIENLEADAITLVNSKPEIERLLGFVDRHPEDLEAKLQFGELMGRARRKGTARLMFEQVIAARPEDWRAWAGLAWVEALDGEERRARVAIERAQILAGDDIEAISALQTRDERITHELGRVLNSTWRRRTTGSER